MTLLRVRWSLLIAVLLVLAAGCDAGPPAAGIAAPETRQVLRRGNGGDPGTLDPARAEDVHAFNVLADLYEGLVGYDADGSLIPAVAHEWQVAPDGLTYTFKLRDDARWSDGTGVSADDFVRAWRRAIAPKTGSAYGYLLHPIAGAVRIGSGELPADTLAAFAPDPLTLVVRLAEPAAHFLSVLAMPVAYPVARGPTDSDGRFRDPDQFVGNGPYVLASWQPGHRLRLAKNRYFRDGGAVAIDAVDYYAIEDPVTELNMYRSGQLDITATVPGPQFAAMQSQRPGELVAFPLLAVYYVAFDLVEAPFDQPALRQALSMAADRERLVELLGRGEVPAYGLVPAGVDGYPGARHEWSALDRARQEELARELYRQAGYSDAEPLNATLLYDAGDDVHETVALAITAMWREVLGAEIRIEKREWKYFLESRDQRAEWDLMRFAWSGDYNHPYTFLEILLSGSPQNLPRYASAAYDADIAAAARHAEPAEQLRRYAAAEARMLADHPVIPLYFFVSKHLVNPEVAGFRPNVLDRHPSRYLSFQ